MADGQSDEEEMLVVLPMIGFLVIFSALPMVLGAETAVWLADRAVVSRAVLVLTVHPA